MAEEILIGRRFWDLVSKEYGKTAGAKWIRHPWAIKLAGNVKGKKVLEIGCGSGTIVNALVRRGAIGVGTDYSKEMLKVARDNAKKYQLDTELILLDARNLKYLYKRKFDLIIISVLLINFASLVTITKVLTEARKILKESGVILLIEPHPAFNHYMRSFFNNTRRTRSINYQNSGKKYKFDMLNPEGVKIESIAYHWRFEDYATVIHNSGLYIEYCFEPPPLKIAHKVDPQWYKTRKRFPSYIFLKVRKLNSRL